MKPLASPDARMAALIKGMLARGDKQHDIAACFGINGGRVAEIHTGQRNADVVAASREELPPPGPYPTPFDLWRRRVALEDVIDGLTQQVAKLRYLEHRR